MIDLNWNPNENVKEIYYSNLVTKQNYKIRINSDEQLKQEYKKTKHFISFDCLSKCDCKTTNGNMIKGQKVRLHLWKSFYTKWAQCLDKPTKVKFPVLITMNKVSKKKWFITRIKNV